MGHGGRWDHWGSFGQAGIDITSIDNLSAAGRSKWRICREEE